VRSLVPHHEQPGLNPTEAALCRVIMLLAVTATTLAAFLVAVVAYRLHQQDCPHCAVDAELAQEAPYNGTDEQ
jgi:hypothetical protein